MMRFLKRNARLKQGRWHVAASRLMGRSLRIVTTVLLLSITSGCGSLGPTTVGRDRFDYVSAISESLKQQILLNIVKLRYADVPVFMDVGQVISGYELEGTLTAGGTIGTGNKNAAGALGDFVNLGAGGRYLDRPTITYSPLTGADFIKTMMTPFPPGSIMFLVEAGWPVDVLLQVSVQAINGMRNEKGGMQGHPADPEFTEVIRLLKKIQVAGGVGFRVQQEKEGQEASMLMFHTRRLTPEAVRDIAEVKRLLRLNPEATDVRVTYGADAQSDREIALHTRSAYQVLIDLSMDVAVPPEHIAERRTIALPVAELERGAALPRLITIHSDTDRQTDPFVQVKYRGYWYWVDDRDLLSKRVFTFLTVLFTLSETGEKIQKPILTIRAN